MNNRDLELIGNDTTTDQGLSALEGLVFHKHNLHGLEAQRTSLVIHLREAVEQGKTQPLALKAFDCTKYQERLDKYYQVGWVHARQYHTLIRRYRKAIRTGQLFLETLPE